MHAEEESWKEYISEEDKRNLLKYQQRAEKVKDK